MIHLHQRDTTTVHSTWWIIQNNTAYLFQKVIVIFVLKVVSCQVAIVVIMHTDGVILIEVYHTVAKSNNPRLPFRNEPNSTG